MSPAEELPADDTTRGQRSFVLWLLVVLGAAFAAYLAFSIKVGECTEAADGGYCTSYTPAYAMAIGIACVAVGAYGVLKLVRR